MRANRYSGPSRRGFTLIELLAVIAIIGVLASIVLGAASYASRKADRTKTVAAMEQLKNALERYRVDKGSYPNLNTTVDNSSFKNAMTDYLGDAELTDAWGQSFHYRRDSRYAYTLWSYGPDGLDKTADDLSNRQGAN